MKEGINQACYDFGSCQVVTEFCSRDKIEEVDEQANEQLEQMIPKMALAEGVTEGLKALDPIRWVGLMNNLKACAEESILSDLIYE